MRKLNALIAVACVAVLGLTAPAAAQLPIQLSFNGGLARPLAEEGDILEQGFHLGVGLKIALIPLQLDGSYDYMDAEGSGDALKILSAALTVPVSLTPPMFPVAIYILGGGGFYNQRAGEKTTDFGITGGLGGRVNTPLLRPFAEMRGVHIFAGDDNFSMLTLTVGVRF